jgi:Tfp pilus assembly protein PilN
VSLITQVLMFVGALIVSFGIVGVLYTVWNNQITKYQGDLKKERLRQTELAAVMAQNERYQQRLRDLETRINTIQTLQNSRIGPAEFMSALGGIVSKTNDLYLFTVSPTGERYEFKGQSGTVESMANFMAFLKNSGSFDNVQLEQFYEDDVSEHVNYKFSLGCQYKPPAGNIPAAGGAAAGPGGPQGAPTQAQGAKGRS